MISKFFKWVSEFWDEHYNGLTFLIFSSIVVLLIVGLWLAASSSSMNYYKDHGYKVLYQNTNPITNLTHFTLGKGEDVVFCTGYLSADKTIVTDGGCSDTERGTQTVSSTVVMTTLFYASR